MAHGVNGQGQDNRPIIRKVVRDLEEVGSYYASFSMDTTFASLTAGDGSALLRTSHDAGNSKAGKGKKACDCNLKFDHASCEEGPWILDQRGKGGYECYRMRNPLRTQWRYSFLWCSSYGSELSLPPFEVRKPYNSAEECIADNKDSIFSPVTVGKDECSESTPTPSPTSTSGKARKHDWCKLDISNCTTVCGRDESAYYVSSKDTDFDFNDNQPVFPNLIGECVRYRPYRVKMISYTQCIDDGFQRMPYKKYKNLDACCRNNGGCGEVKSDSAVWRDDQCLLPIDDRLDQNLVSASDERCSTFFTCEQCIDSLSTQLTDPDAVEEVNSASYLDLKNLFDYTLYQSGMLGEGESRVNVVGECGPCINHLLDKFSTPTSASAGEAEEDIQSFFESFFGSLLNEIIGLKRVSDTDLMPLYDYLTEYSGQYVSTRNLSGERRMEKRQIDFRVRC
jgi:hypothetical protein